jgi:hypothetical protein
LLVISAAVPLATAARADGFNYGVDAGVGESDNVTLVETNKVSQTMAIADLDFSLKEKSSRLDEDVTGDFTYLDFLQHAYGSEVLGQFNGLVRYSLIPQSLTWTVQDNWAQAQQDPFGALVPSNQQNINYLSTGPDWYARLGSTSFLDITARYAHADYQVTPIDNNRAFGSVQLGHEISALSSVSLNGTAERVLYENTLLNEDFDLDSVYVRYELHGARTDFSANLGIDKVTEAGTSNSGLDALLKLTRRISSAAKITVEAGRNLTDPSAGFNALQNSNVVNAVVVNNVVSNVPAPVTSSIYTASYVAGAWNYERNRTTLGLSARWEKDAYVDQPEFDGSRNRFDASIERRMTHALSARLYASIYQTRYDHDQFVATDPGFTDQDGLYGFAVVLREGRGLEIRLRYDHLSRNISAGAGTGYEENRVFLTIGYRPQPYTPQP